ncbi:redoxin domain-containing protein [Micromonospora sp. GCM10011542]|uniref:redoxin domain-containing protein n=1 Tax=Micromonospora sp. GCM10011542 TaxID=3317337 RepID=UPI003617FC50
MTVRIPQFTVERWVNSPPLTPDALRGRVVLVDIWEYTCINWIRTSPYVKAWHRDYADLGLTVIGVHAPEFEFGKRAENIDRGIRDHQLTYPIALDNDFTFWRALGNIAWPARYLFDADGRLVERWIGEGDYDRTEAEIRRLLVAGTAGADLPPATPEAAKFVATPQPSYADVTEETYLGADRGIPGSFQVTGDWHSGGDYVELLSGPGEIALPFNAGEVNLVVHPGPSGDAALTVRLDGRPVGDERGADVGPDAVARIDGAGMIRLVAGASRDDHLLTLTADQPGFRAYAFTFGP